MKETFFTRRQLAIKNRINDLFNKGFITKNAYNAKYKLEFYKDLARQHNGDCLSDEYINARTNLRWKCQKGHEWEALPYSAVRGCWCPVCCRDKFKLGIEKMREIAASHGGECLSSEYHNINTKLTWKCSEDHIWDAYPEAVRRGTWCPVCYGHRRLTIKKMQQAAAEKGGYCLSEKYKNTKTKLRWKCDKGHEWDARPSSILNGTWCPKCYWERRRTS